MWRFFAIIIAALFIFQACAKNSGPQDSCNFVTNSDQQRVSWHSKLPIQMYINDNVPSTYYPAIQDAMGVWNKSLNMNVFSPPLFTSTPDTGQSSGYSVIYWVTQNWFGTLDEQARTSIYYVDNQIYEADIRVDAQNFNFSLDNPEPGAVDFESLMIHELGHVMGLVHIPTTQSVMFKSLANDTLRRDPSPIDLNSLQCEY